MRDIDDKMERSATHPRLWIQQEESAKQLLFHSLKFRMDTEVEKRQKDQMMKVDERNTKKKEKEGTEESEQLLARPGVS